MPAIAATLNTIWAIFERARILETPRVLQGIASLLGHQSRLNSALLSLLPPVPNELTVTEQTEVINQLNQAASDAKIPVSQLFDRYVLFRLREMLPGSRYPTPRHLIEFLYNLAEVESAMSLADLSCGSGGFLAHHMRQPSASGACFGVEVDAEWVGLAAANLILHAANHTATQPLIQLFRQDALDLTQQEQVPPSPVDRVLSNPPFEEPVHTKLLERILDSLANDGRAAVLVPAGTLFNTTTELVQVRKRMVGALADTTDKGDFQLQAVIELPKNACQPFSAITTSALLVKHETDPHPLTWFLRAEKDAYTGAKGRYLTRPPHAVESTVLAVQ